MTMPHKRAMVGLVDGLDDGARVSGAVNTVVIDASGMRGYNTDGGGMVMACQEAGVDLSGKSVLLLGAGGTASAIAVAIGEAGVADLHIANRDVVHAARLRDKLRLTGVEKISVGSLAALEQDAPDVDVIVNATPLGMKEGDALPLPPGYVRRGRAVCDVVYRPGRVTPLVRLAKERGARYIAGGRMLLYQGVLAQKLWTGRNPNVEAMDRAIS